MCVGVEGKKVEMSAREEKRKNSTWQTKKNVLKELRKEAKGEKRKKTFF